MQKKLNQLTQKLKDQILYWDNAYPEYFEDLKNFHQNEFDKAILNKSKNSFDYELKRAIVFNKNLELKDASKIKYIIIGDNPGKNEQQKEEYLIGLSGKLARNFFSQMLNLSFDEHVLVLNKTPLHTPRTNDLKVFSSKYQALLKESQIFMANLIFEYHKLLNCDLWINGYSQLTKKGVFSYFLAQIQENYRENTLKNKLFVFRHFSMNQFSTDLKKQKKEDENTLKALKRIGENYRIQYLGF